MKRLWVIDHLLNLISVLAAPWHIDENVCYTFFANDWQSNRDITIGESSTSHINSEKKLSFSVRQCKEEGAEREREKKGLKVTQIILQQTYWTVTHGQDVPRWTDCDPLQAECPSHLDLLECLFQLWTLHCFFGAYHLGFAMSDQLKAEWDYLGVLCTAVLPVDWQLHWWCFQTHVSIHIRCNHQLVRWCSLGLWSLKQFLIFFF